MNQTNTTIRRKMKQHRVKIKDKTTLCLDDEITYKI